MDYSFECGACHAIYKLDENQITDKGVKITCPKCLSYFILKKGSIEGASLDSAYIEYLVQDDGIQNQQTTKSPPPAPPRSQFTEGDRTEKIIIGDKTEKIKVDQISGDPKEPAKKAFSRQSSSPYPLNKEEKSKILPYVMVFIVMAAIFWILWSIL